MTDSLRSRPKKLLAKGKNAMPAGLLKLRTYRVEEVALPKAVEVEVRGRNETVQSVILLTIRGGPFPVRALPPVIWIDDVAFEHVQESQDLRELSTVIYDPSVLREGATISVSYGSDEASRVALPERLTFNRASR